MSPFVVNLTIFVLAIFVGFSVVWRVTPALHSPLMAVTNAVSSVIVIGALMGLRSWSSESAFAAGFLCFFALVLCMINIVGGFLITHRQLDLFRQKRPTNS